MSFDGLYGNTYQLRTSMEVQLAGLGSDPKQASGSVHLYYDKITKTQEKEGAAMRRFDEFTPPHNRSALYVASLGGQEGRFGWGRITLDDQDSTGEKIKKFVRDRVPPIANSRVRLSVKYNGVQVMTIWKLDSDVFKLTEVVGKQGDFDGVHCRNAGFAEITRAMIDNKSLKIPDGVLPEGVTHLLIQAELAKALTENVNFKAVCHDVFAFSNGDQAARHRILEGSGLRLFIFNSAIYRPQDRTQSASVEPMSFRVRKAITDICTQSCSYFRKVEAHVFESFEQEQADFVEQFYSRYGPPLSEGFILDVEEVVGDKLVIKKYKAKIVYNKKGYVVKAGHYIPLLMPVSGALPAGIICATPMLTKTCRQLNYTMLDAFKMEERETGMGFSGSGTWSAFEQLITLYRNSISASLVTKVGECDRYSQFKVDDETYEIEKWLLKDFSLKFVKFGALTGQLFYNLRCNQILHNFRGMTTLDTVVYSGLTASMQFDYTRLIEMLHSEHFLSMDQKCELKMLVPSFPREHTGPSCDIWVESELKDFFHWNCTSLQPGSKPVMINWRPLYKAVAERERVESRTKKTSAPSRPHVQPRYGLTALAEANNQFGHLCMTPQNLGNALLHFPSDEQCRVLGEKLCRGISFALTTQEKNQLTRVWRRIENQLIEMSKTIHVFEKPVAECRSTGPVAAPVVESRSTGPVAAPVVEPRATGFVAAQVAQNMTSSPAPSQTSQSSIATPPVPTLDTTPSQDQESMRSLCAKASERRFGVIQAQVSLAASVMSVQPQADARPAPTAAPNVSAAPKASTAPKAPAASPSVVVDQVVPGNSVATSRPAGQPIKRSAYELLDDDFMNPVNSRRRTESLATSAGNTPFDTVASTTIASTTIASTMIAPPATAALTLAAAPVVVPLTAATASDGAAAIAAVTGPPPTAAATGPPPTAAVIGSAPTAAATGSAPTASGTASGAASNTAVPALVPNAPTATTSGTQGVASATSNNIEDLKSDVQLAEMQVERAKLQLAIHEHELNKARLALQLAEREAEIAQKLAQRNKT